MAIEANIMRMWRADMILRQLVLQDEAFGLDLELASST